MAEDQCKTCRFFKVRSDDRLEGWSGYCVRFPPSFQLQNTLNDGWPNVHGQEWCGEFRSNNEISMSADGRSGHGGPAAFTGDK